MLKNTGQLSLLILLATAIAGCSSVPMPKGTSKGYSSVQFIAPNKPIDNDTNPVFVESNRMIIESISAEMEKKGLKVVEEGADLIVAHLIILQDNVSTSYNNQFYGYQDFSELVDLAHKEGMKKSYPVPVLKRALVIDLIDARTFKLVYRDYVVNGAPLAKTEEEKQERTSLAVEQALQKFFK